MNVKRRLEELEERLGTDRESLEDAVSCEVISRITTEELGEYTDALKHLRDREKPQKESNMLR